MADEALRELGEYISESLGSAVTDARLHRDQLIVRVERERIVDVMTFLRDDATCRFQQLMNISGVDYPDERERFELCYELLSLHHNQRVRVKVTTDEDTPVDSVTAVYSSANWFEREIWDLFGVFFADHPDLRRIMTDYGFEGHPLRKDFPLTGYVEPRYDDEQKRVVYEPVKLTQDFRTFDFMSPWEGMTAILPGDEKVTGEAEAGEGAGEGHDHG